MVDSKPQLRLERVLQAKPAHDTTGNWLQFGERKQRDPSSLHEHRQGELQHVCVIEILRRPLERLRGRSVTWTGRPLRPVCTGYARSLPLQPACVKAQVV